VLILVGSFNGDGFLLSLTKILGTRFLGHLLGVLAGFNIVAGRDLRS